MGTRPLSSGRVYSLSLPTHLIQTIRIYQALMESGEQIAIEEADEPKFVYLKRFFDFDFNVGTRDTIMLTNLGFSHSKPSLRLGTVERPLLFPHSIVERSRSVWLSEREYDYLFVGLLTPERDATLRSWLASRAPQRLAREKIWLENSGRGRVFPGKLWDEEYVSKLGRSKFVLCPKGDFNWTYRFFEAALCGAIPVVESGCAIYTGFSYYTLKNIPIDAEWTYATATRNYEIAKKRLTLPRSVIAEQLRQNRVIQAYSGRQGEDW